jgi:3' terminal RNA ribose 2'-O-methyltransferase Hen1
VFGNVEKRSKGHRRVRHDAGMLLTVTTTHRPATDLGFMLHKHPERAQVFPQSFGRAHVFYPEASATRCTAALLLEIDPIDLVRGAKGRTSPDFSLGQYVNDRPYAASSLLAVALGQVFRSAMRGDSRERSELAATAIPLELRVPALPCRGGPSLAGDLFGPLGWEVEAEPVALDPAFPEWGDSRYVSLTLRGTLRLSDALNHLYVLLPVLDDAKHYWVCTDEIDKLVRAGDGWLGTHPKRGLITSRYLAHQRALTNDALARLADVDDVEPEALDNAADPAVAFGAISLAEARRRAIIEVLGAESVARVLDLGCGPGALLAELLKDARFTEIVGTDVSHRSLEMAARKLRLDRISERQSDRISLLHSSVTYRDPRLRGYDAAVLMEVVEHIDPPRLPVMARSIFGDAAPRVVVVTTPNVEHNVRYEGLTVGTMRHADHRFEWTRAEFAGWADALAADYGYAVRYLPVGPDDPEVGPPTQMAVFTR